MISKWCLPVAGLAGLLICFAAEAQTHGSAASGNLGSVRGNSGARTVLARPRNSGTTRQTTLPAGRHANVTFVSPSGHGTPRFAHTGNFDGFENSDDVPGLGFDYTHLAAINAGRQNSSFRFGHHEHNGGGGSFVPIWFGGYPFYYDDSSYEQPAQQVESQPQVIVIQPPAQPAADSSSEAARPAAVVSAPEASEPVRDVGEFILVRRDGRIVFASLFSVIGEQLQYITPEGMRRTIPLADLDSDATLQMNEARGTTVQLHN